MMVKSRTQRSIQNVRVALIYYFINLIISFISRKIFIEYLGTEILGLNTTVVNLLQFLNLAELGIGAAISYTLYQPLADNNRDKICEIVSVQGYMYRKIAGFVILGSFILMCFFPFIFAKPSYLYGMLRHIFRITNQFTGPATILTIVR